MTETQKILCKLGDFIYQYDNPTLQITLEEARLLYELTY